VAYDIHRCLPLSSLVTPATLFVLPSVHISWTNAQVRSLDMYSSNQTTRFTYSVQSNSSGSESEQFLGPRTIISRLSTATATQGQILPISPPFPNSTYALEFYGPAVQCREANSSVATIIKSLRKEAVMSFRGNIVENSDYYFAFVPDLSNVGNSSAPNGGVTPVSQVRLQQPQNASNQLWMAFSRYTLDTAGQRTTEDYCLLCQLYNATYNINLAFEEGSQTIQDQGTQLLNPVDYPDANAPVSADLMVQHAYSAFMWALTDLLVGSMGIFTEETSSGSNVPTNFGEITTQIEHTSLLGSSDLDAYFDGNHALHSNNSVVSDQRLQDIALAKNRTLDILIEELAYNTTLSFMNSNLLSYVNFSPPVPSLKSLPPYFIDPPSSPSVTQNVTVKASVNTYNYHSENLLLSYGLAIFFALLSNTLGALAYRTNGVSHNKSFSAILTSTRDAGLMELFHAQTLGRLPLPQSVRRARLRFGGLRDGGLGFMKA
jgi:hypothetical protein